MFAYDIETKEKRSAQLDPLVSEIEGKDIFLLPGGCTWLEPLPEKNGFKVVFSGNEWVYEAIPEPEPEPDLYVPDPKEQEISELKGKLIDSDYAIIKIAEGAATREEYADLIKQRQEWRARINELEAENE